jgi:hypothetical protein
VISKRVWDAPADASNNANVLDAMAQIFLCVPPHVADLECMILATGEARRRQHRNGSGESSLLGIWKNSFEASPTDIN